MLKVTQVDQNVGKKMPQFKSNELQSQMQLRDVSGEDLRDPRDVSEDASMPDVLLWILWIIQENLFCSWFTNGWFRNTGRGDLSSIKLQAWRPEGL